MIPPFEVYVPNSGEPNYGLVFGFIGSHCWLIPIYDVNMQTLLKARGIYIKSRMDEYNPKHCE